MSNIVIDIAAEFTGNKAFKQAESATDKLGKQAKKLAAAFGLGLSATAVLAYGKAAVKAAVEDEKAQKQLALALKNVGLGRDAAASEAYIQKLQSEFGIVDDLLRPAYQTLAVATRDSAESQRLLNLALDISASTGKDLGSVTAALSKAYLGNNTSLSKLGVGISKADLKTKSFLEVTDELAKTFAGAATESANSLAGQMAKLEVASANVQEILGKGIIDSLIILSGNTSVDELATDMETAATNAAAFLATLSEIVRTINAPLMAVSGSLADFIEKTSPFVNLIIEGDPSGFMKKKPKPFTTPMTISGQVQLKLEKEIAKLIKQQSDNQAKILKDKKLQAAIDKANLALGKGSDVFDMDKIQIAAALTNQAEQLGKATSSAQIMQIANDTARLNVKRSILALEDAIAAKDEAAIIAATAKLNADLKVLGTLTGQKVTLTNIESILAGLKPKDLINQANLDEAMRKIQEMLRLLALVNAQVKVPIPKSSTLGSGIPSGDYIAPIPMEVGTSASIAALIEASEAIQGRADAFAYLLDLQTKADTEALMSSSLALGTVAQLFSTQDVARSSLLAGLSGGAGVAGAVSGSRYAAQAANYYNITVQTGIGDPNAIAETIQQYIVDATDRGTLRGGSTL
jgi:hypothetical protein